MSGYTEEINRRRTFAIISHPDAGKTTLTEKFLLYGGAINLAGSVKGKATARHAVSDWMEIEKERGISVTSSVLQFEYDGYCINILDTPGHQDFSEDTYRTLMAADSAVMVIDASKGVEAQTRKLFKVCGMRGIPIFTFINKMDRDANDTFELLDEIEKELGIATCPVNWPIGSGKGFKGVYDRERKCVISYSDTEKGTKEGTSVEVPIQDEAHLRELIGDEAADKLEMLLPTLDCAAEQTLRELGCDASVQVTLGQERYPTRTYDGFCFPSGEYLSLRVLIGDAEGQNWWCVLFPSLCLSVADGGHAEKMEGAFISVGLTPEQYRVITESDENTTYKLRFKFLELLEEWHSGLRKR